MNDWPEWESEIPPAVMERARKVVQEQRTADQLARDAGFTDAEQKRLVEIIDYVIWNQASPLESVLPKAPQ